MPRSRSSVGLPAQPDSSGAYPTPPPHALAEIRRVNSHYIALLVEAARREGESGLPLIEELRDALRQMTPERCQRGGARAFLVADFRLSDLPWWTQMKSDRRFQGGLGPSAGLARADAVPLTRAILVLAWLSTRAHAAFASVVFGMTPAVSSVIAELSLPEIDEIAKRHYRCLRPRWENVPGIWLQWLAASETPDIRKARDCDLRGLQMILETLCPTEAAAPQPLPRKKQ
jgi:hypothetical protein